LITLLTTEILDGLCNQLKAIKVRYYYKRSSQEEPLIFSKAPYINEGISHLRGANNPSIVVGMWDRSGAWIAKDDKGREAYLQSPTPDMATKIKMKYLSWTIDVTFLTQDVLNLEVLENQFLIEMDGVLPSEELEITPSLQDVIGAVAIKVDGKISLVDKIEKLPSQDLGDLWKMEVKIDVTAPVFSYILRDYPKIKDVYTNLKEISGETNIADLSTIHLHQEYASDGSISSREIEILKKGG